MLKEVLQWYKLYSRLRINSPHSVMLLQNFHVSSNLVHVYTAHVKIGVSYQGVLYCSKQPNHLLEI